MTIFLRPYFCYAVCIVGSRLGRGAFGVVLALLLPLWAIGQQPTAALPQATAEQTQTAGAQTAIKARVRQVLLDVVVTDNDNHAVTGLHQQNFSVLEDGKPQQILSFEAHAAADTARPGPEPPKVPQEQAGR